MMPDLERLIVIHPHAEFDGSLKAKGAIGAAIEQFNHKNGEVLVVQGFKELPGHVKTNRRLPMYLRRGLKYRLTQSEGGEISTAVLRGLVTDNGVINLMGGMIGQCHRSAFESIVNYMQSDGIKNVSFVMPFDGCYFQHSWTEWGHSWERVKDPSKYRFDGVLMGGCGYEMNGADSYSLSEVITRTFGEMDELRHRKQLRDTNGDPILATSDAVLRNALEYFFGGYFTTPRGEAIVKRAYETRVTDSNFQVHVQ
ncbi:hypothetical protein HYV82_06200 [Candidatus Woesearchaeota archaeon]|nr:hypothetical protein [Candidatus Woesearchaeota archaeon]